LTAYQVFRRANCIERGELRPAARRIYGLIGPGKTTLLSILAGSIPTTSGTVGRVVLEGLSEELRTSDHVRRAYLGVAD